MNRALAFLALAGLSTLPCAHAQGIPEALKDTALAIRVHATVPMSQIDTGAAPGGQGEASLSPSSPAKPDDKSQPWEAETTKYTVPGSPAAFKLVGSNIAIVLQVTPYENVDGKGLTLIAQGMVWVKPPEGGLSYHTAVDTLSVDYGETVLFFPLGVGADGQAPIRLEIKVLRAADSPASPDESPGDKPADKAGK